MSISVSSQVHIFLYSILGGIVIGFIYDIFRIKRQTVKTKSFIVHIEDFFYWILIAIIMFAVVYYSNEGELRGYIFFGAIIGAVLYMLTLSRIVIKSSILILNAAAKVFRLLFKIILYPFRVIFRLLYYPARVLKRQGRKGMRSIRGFAKTQFTKVNLWSKAFKNARKKI